MHMSAHVKKFIYTNIVQSIVNVSRIVSTTTKQYISMRVKLHNVLAIVPSLCSLVIPFTQYSKLPISVPWLHIPVPTCTLLLPGDQSAGVSDQGGPRVDPVPEQTQHAPAGREPTLTTGEELTGRPPAERHRTDHQSGLRAEHQRAATPPVITLYTVTHTGDSVTVLTTRAASEPNTSEQRHHRSSLCTR